MGTFSPSESNQGLDEPVNHDYNVLEEPEQTCSEVDEDNNTLCEPRPADENPEMPLEPTVFVNIENNPAYAALCKKHTKESARKRSNSM